MNNPKFHLDDIAEKDNEKIEIKKKLEEVLLKNKELENQLIKKEQQLLSLSKTNEESVKHIKKLQVITDKSIADKKLIEESEFWKITKPFRTGTDFAKNILKRNKTQEYYSYDQKIKDLNSLFQLFQKGENGRKAFGRKEFLNETKENGRKILLVTHEMALTGAPVALLYFAKVLKEQGDIPILISPHEGRLIEECEKYGILSLIEPCIYKENPYKEYIELFDIVIANTIVSAPIINGLSDSHIPVLWWIHEAETSYNVDDFYRPMPQHLPYNVTVYTVGEYAYKKLLEHKPMYSAGNLLYYIPEEESKGYGYKLPEMAKNKTVFCIVGLQEYRKGQDVLANAIKILPKDDRDNCYFIFVGKKCFEPIFDEIKDVCSKYPENVLYIEELGRKDINALYDQIDCLICASRDDPMPIVATEAMQHGKAVICSENTGTADVVKKEACGLIYHNDDAKELAQKIKEIISNKNKMIQFGKNGEKAYLKLFSQKAFWQEVKRCLEETEKNARDRFGKYKLKEFLSEIKGTETITVYNEDVLKEYSKDENKKILLVTHELSLTGAPLVLLRLANVLYKENYDVIIISPVDGKLKEEIVKNKIPCIIDNNIYDNNIIRKYAKCFSGIILNTVVTYRLVKKLSETVPIIWWIHDSEASYKEAGFSNIMPLQLPSNVHVYCAGEYAKEKLIKYYPSYASNTEVLYYDVVDKNSIVNKFELEVGENIKNIFTIIGKQEKRKGQDILAKAIQKMPKLYRESSLFLFIGAHEDKKTEKIINKVCKLYPKNVKYIESVEHEKIFTIIHQSDCVICTSKDDPLPVFMTEAMMMGKMVICSENTGTAPIIRQEKCGLVYENNSVWQLIEKIKEVINNPEQKKTMGKLARKAYLKYFSEKIFEDNVREIAEKYFVNSVADNLYYAGTVSIVIPTYNPGKQLEELLKRLTNQKNVKKIEIVMVDSGSKDGSLEIAKKYDIKLIEIKNEDFSHSYARNLGADNATGNILLFMTQDALPIGDMWIREMIDPIIEGKVAAVSGRELCPKSTELFYKIATVGYAKFCRTNVCDQLNFIEENVQPEELRRKASLTDIACAINRNVFKKMRYRYNYAEDLDMGVRLLRNGYKIKLLSDVRVLHGHNRTCGYYIKRTLVEQMAFERILPECASELDDIHRVSLRIISTAEAVGNVLLKVIRNVGKDFNELAYLDSVIYELNKYIFNPRLFSGMVNKEYSDYLLNRCLEICSAYCTMDFIGDYSIIYSLIEYIKREMKPYLKKHADLSSEKNKKIIEINDCIIKQMSVYFGYELSRLRYGIVLTEKFKDFLEGV